MGNNRTPGAVLLAILVIMLLGCHREIGEVTIKIVPDHGCVPLQVDLVGTANVKEGIRAAFSWTVGGQVHLQGPKVQHTFNAPGTYDISLTVTGEQDKMITTTAIDVRAAEVPTAPGLYLRKGCAYQAVPGVEETKNVKQLGKTSLEDLEQRIVGRPLSTPELITHPLWRREHTHTVHTLAREQFVTVSQQTFQAFGFMLIGEEASQVTLFKILPSPEPAPDTPAPVVMRVVDSWNLDNVEPERQALQSTRVAPNGMHYVAEEHLPEGLYFIEVTREGEATPGIYPLALVASDN